MMSLEDYKTALGSSAERLSEEQILELREKQDQLAEIFFAMWKEEISTSKNEI